MISRSMGVLCAGIALGSIVAARPSPGRRSTPPAPLQVSGQTVYNDVCAVCHQPSGEGNEEMYPPLAGSEWVNGDAGRMVRIILNGLTGPVEVAGVEYNSVMPAWGATLSDAQLAAVATYVRSAWGNKGSAVSTAEVTAIRAAGRSRTTPWTVRDLMAATVTATEK